MPEGTGPAVSPKMQVQGTHTHTHTQTHTYTHRAAADKFIFRRQRLKNVNLTMD